MAEQLFAGKVYENFLAAGPTQYDISSQCRFPATVLLATPWQSLPIATNGMNLSIGGVLDQSATVSVQRFLDTAGYIPVGSAVTSSFTADTANTVSIVETASSQTVAQSMVITITDTGADTANLTQFTAVLRSIV